MVANFQWRWLLRAGSNRMGGEFNIYCRIPHCVCVCLQNTVRSDTTPWDPKCKQDSDLKQAG